MWTNINNITKIQNKAKNYVSPFCGKNSVRRVAGGIWKCKRILKIIESNPLAI